ncbi:MAG TPA: YjbQ family protein [Deltaproteobacteria bacterium]|nr:YjbQ family protein [Deltaproteobacteria bacterium]
MLKRLEVKTSSRIQVIDITSHIKSLLKSEGMSSGHIIVFVPHTTCGITINENADPSVKQDMIDVLNTLVPENSEYRHLEGNSDAHIKSSIIGSSASVFVEAGALVLGTWQGIFLTEFDGPRIRSVLLKMIPDSTT